MLPEHKDAMSKKVPSTFVHVFPLDPQREPENKPQPLLPEPQRLHHFQLSTPPPIPPGLERPIQALEFPTP